MYRFINIPFLGRPIASYGLCMVVAAFLSGFLAIRSAKKRGISFEDMIVVIMVAFGSAIFGGGFLYIIVSYTPTQIFNYIKNLDFSFLFSGGIVFYGGLIGGILGAWISAKIMKVEIGALEKSVVPYVPLAHAIGRVGCLLAGCCYGFEYDGIFAVINKYVSPDHTYFPVQPLESVLNLVIMVILLQYVKKERRKYSVLTLYLLMYAVMRFCTEFFRFDEYRGRFLMFSTSQWISILIVIVCGLFHLFYSMNRKPEKA